MPGPQIGQACWVLAGICRHKRFLSQQKCMLACLHLTCGEDLLEGLLSLLDLSSDMRMNMLIHGGAAKLYVGRTQCRGFQTFWVRSHGILGRLEGPRL